MVIEKLDNVLESLLFLSGEALGMDTIAQALELQKSEIKRSEIGRASCRERVCLYV